LDGMKRLHFQEGNYPPYTTLIVQPFYLVTDMLSKEQILKHLEYDSESGVFKRKGNSSRPRPRPTGSIRDDGYVRIVLLGKRYYAHRLAWVICHGEIDDEMQIDHIDCDPSNNCIANLRLASQSQNNHNQKLCKRNTSGTKGVIWSEREGKWKAICWLNNKPHNAGTFSNIDDAISAQKSLRERLHGRYSRIR